VNLSVVIPVYRSADCVPELARRLEAALSPTGVPFEVILVDDASPDRSWDAIREAATRHPFIRGVRLRRNTGQDNAIMAGLHEATGDVVVVMDDDLQHDPADIPRLTSALETGDHDVVYARFDAKRQAGWKNIGSWLNDRLAVVILQKPRHVYLSPFKAMRRAVVDEILRYDGPFTYVDGLLFTVTERIGQVTVEHHARFAGRGNYGLVRSVRVALKLATNFSVVPLRVATIMGGLMSLVAFALGLYFIYEALFLARPPEGWPSLMVTVLFLGGVQLVGLGAVGEYIGRIYITQNRRPQFTVRERCRGVGPGTGSAD